MSASFLVGPSSISSQSTISRASRVGNGRLQNRLPGERGPESQRGEKAPNPVNAATEADERGYRSTKSLEQLFDSPLQEGKNRKLKLPFEPAPAYSAEKRRKPQIDFLA